MGASSNRKIGLDYRGTTAKKWLIGMSIGSGDTPSHKWADLSPEFDTVADLIAAGWVSKYVKLLEFVAGVDLPDGGDLVREYIKYHLGGAYWTNIENLGETDAIDMLTLLKAKADAGWVTP